MILTTCWSVRYCTVCIIILHAVHDIDQVVRALVYCCRQYLWSIYKVLVMPCSRTLCRAARQLNLARNERRLPVEKPLPLCLDPAEDVDDLRLRGRHPTSQFLHEFWPCKHLPYATDPTRPLELSPQTVHSLLKGLTILRDVLHRTIGLLGRASHTKVPFAVEFRPSDVVQGWCRRFGSLCNG